MIKVFITDLASYNEGILVGEWVELPMDRVDLKDKIQEILEEGLQASRDRGLCNCNNHEEYFITDVEGDMRIDQYDNVLKLNSQLEELFMCEEDDRIVELIMGFFDDAEEVLDIVGERNYIVFSGVETKRDVVEDYLYMTGTQDDVPAWLEGHIDYESIYRSWEVNNTFIWGDDGLCIELLQ